MFKTLKTFLERYWGLLHAKFSEWRAHMIGAMEKGIEAARLSTPPEGSYEGVNLKVLPKYICFRAAMLREKVALQYVVLVLASFLLAHLVASKSEISGLQTKLREKEYILAPGVQDFIPAAPNTVPEKHVEAAALDYLLQFGNVNAVNIDEQYERLASSMSLSLRAQFLAEVQTWKQKVKAENITETMKVLKRELFADDKGTFKCKAFVRTESYVNSEYIGYRDEVIHLTMTLVPPEDGKKWYLALSSLSRTSDASSKVEEQLTKGGK